MAQPTIIEMSTGDPALPIRWFKHAGRDILCADLRDLDRQKFLVTVEQYRQALAGQPDQSVLLLAHLGRVEFHPEAMTHGRRVLMDSSGKILRSALIVESRLLHMAVERFYDAARMMGHDLSQRGREFPPDHEAAAMDWLVHT